MKRGITNRLYLQHSQGITDYHRIRGTSRRTRSRGFVRAGEIYGFPSDTVDTMIWQKTNTTYISGHRERGQSAASIRYGTFKQYLADQQQYAWLFRKTLFSIKFQDLVEAMDLTKGGEQCHGEYWKIPMNRNNG
jgi:hypothetical protein